jgi:hypothetical protein
MKTFKEFLEEKYNQLHVFDIDDTLVHPTAKVRIRDQHGNVTHTLNSHQYAHHVNNEKLPHGHSYDFSEFRSADKFHDESKPIKPMINKVKELQKDKGNHIIFNTARSNMDNKKKFLDTFRKHGLDMKKIHVIRAGNITSKESGDQKKARVVSGYVKKHKYQAAHMYDDDKKNLTTFSKLHKMHPNTSFSAHHVQPNGSTHDI